MSTLLQDLRYAVRLLTRTPFFTAVVLLTVALGVGANTAVFAVVNAALLKNLPYPAADRILVADDLSGGEIVDWRHETKSFSAIAAERDGTFDLTSGSDRPERLIGATTDWRFFDVMGVAPALGRGFTQDDERAGQHVVVLSSALWRSRLAGDPNAVGRSIVLGGEAYTIIGVMPPAFGTPSDTQLWVAAQHQVPDHPQRPGVDMSGNHSSHYLTVYARLAPGVGLAAAQAEQVAIFLRIAARYPTDMSASEANITLLPLRDYLVGDVRSAALVLLAVVGLVLLIGCANVANLLLARATARAQEISVRAALGAGRFRIARQLLTESALLAVLGGGLGVLTAAWALPTLMAISPGDVASLHPDLSAPVLLFALGVSLVTGLIFGCAPALQASGKMMAGTLQAFGRTTDGRQTARLRQTLIVAECAASVTLLVLAGLLIRSFDSLLRVDPGFDPAGRQVARLVLPTARYATPASQSQFFDRLSEQLRASPGISGVALAARLPFVGGDSTRSIDLDHPLPNVNAGGGIRVVSPGYFEVLGQHLLQGRGFTAHDVAGAPLVAVVNETMARTYWPGQSAIGHRFRITRDWIEIVGVAADVKHGSLREPISPEFYQPYAQAPWPFMAVVIQTPLAANAVTATLDHALASIDPELPTPSVRPMTALITGSLAMDRFEMIGLVVFAGVGLALAVIGLYGVMSYLVSRRTREMGLRIALGASPAGIARLVMVDGLRLMAVGAGAGVLASLAAARVIQSWLFGVRMFDPATVLVVTGLLAATAALACYLPARRAMSVDPMTALRAE